MREGEILAGTYELVRQIGEGGMGAVYEGRHRRIGRRVAIKLLRGAHGERTSPLAPRLLREAQAAAGVGSDHIVEVFDAGETEGGEPFLVMEFLEGEDLGQILAREGPFTVERAAHLLIQVCRALAAAHDCGVVHRDLKPGNLFLTRRSDGAEWIKVLDFGIAKVLEDLDDPEDRLTVAGEMLGTPYYMAPENVGGSGTVDHRADVYSAGAVLFELLTGRPPFREGTVRKLIVQISTEDPPTLQSIRPELPEGLEEIVNRALAKPLDERYQSMDDLALALAPFAGDGDDEESLAAPKSEERGTSTSDAAPVEASKPFDRSPTSDQPAEGSSENKVAPPDTLVQPGRPSAKDKVRSSAPRLGGLAARSQEVKERLLGLYEEHRMATLIGGGAIVVLVFVLAIIIQAMGGDETADVPQPGCPPEKVQNEDTGGHCCWPGQVWSETQGRCTGGVQCPPGRRRLGDECRCYAGMIESSETDGHCCWPGQIWSDGQAQCAGEPQCGDGFRRARDLCVPQVKARGDWVVISVGSFTMGSAVGEPGRDDDEQEHEISLERDFLLMAMEVTQDQFTKEMGYSPAFSKKCGVNCPVEGVAWHEAAAYTNALSKAENIASCYSCRGTEREVRCSPVADFEVPWSCPGYRLPTEAEWEYAVRAGTESATYGGDLSPGLLECENPNMVLVNIAWFCGNAKRAPHRVGTLSPNRYGLFDMLGNVWEWSHDPYREVYDLRGDGGSPTERRVIRGGSWSGHAERARASSRESEDPTVWRRHIGFRVARTL